MNCAPSYANTNMYVFWYSQRKKVMMINQTVYFSNVLSSQNGRLEQKFILYIDFASLLMLARQT